MTAKSSKGVRHTAVSSRSSSLLTAQSAVFASFSRPFPRNFFFPAIRSSNEHSQRPSYQKQYFFVSLIARFFTAAIAIVFILPPVIAAAPNNTLNVAAREFKLTQVGNSEPAYAQRGEVQTWKIPINKNVTGTAQFNKNISFSIGVSGRGRISADVSDATYKDKITAHAQDDQYEGYTSLTHRYRDELGGDCKLEIMVWRTRTDATAVDEATAKPELAKDIADYFLRIPHQQFTEGSPTELLANIKRSESDSILDSKNGYMRLSGDGAQVSLQVALFRYQDKRPLLVVSWGELEEPDFTHVTLFREDNDRMVVADRKILPVGDSAKLRFEMPRHGRTIIVREASGSVVSRWTWKNDRFQKE